MISTVFMKKAKIPVTVDIQRVTGILYVLKCQRWDKTSFGKKFFLKGRPHFRENA